MIKELNNSHQKRYIDVMKYHSNIPRTIKSVINFRIKVLEHKNQYSINSAIDAFNVSRSTIYSWQKAYIQSWCIQEEAIITYKTKNKKPRGDIHSRL